MRQRWRMAVAVLAGALLVAGPATADDFTGAEEQEQTLSCPAAGEGVPANQEPPGPGECPGTEENETYEGYVWDNDVDCADGAPVSQQGVNLYVTYSMEDIGAGMCNEGDTVPVQGRVVTYGSFEQEGFSVYADGDKDNDNATAQGWARGDLTLGRQGIRCGDDGGKLDATHPDAIDEQADCG